MIAACCLVAAGYLAGLRALPAEQRRWGHALSFAVGLAGVLATCTGPVEGRAGSSYAWWVGQGLALLLVVPVPLLLGHPAQVAGRFLPRVRAGRYLPHHGGLLSGPILSAAIVPVAAGVFFFGAVPGWAAGSRPAAVAVQAALLAVGLAVTAALLPAVDRMTSAAVGMALAVGVVELLLDAVPGIVMRLSTHPVSTWYSAARPFSLADQQNAGSLLWSVAELVDLPFLVLLFRRWVRADAREAAAADESAGHPMDPQRPWFLDDPRLRDRFR